MLTIVPSNQFKKDLKIAKKRGLNLEKLTFVINTLASESKLDEKYRDHSLSGVLKEFRECHIESGWLLVYRIDHDELILFLFRTGSHSDLFYL